MTPEQIETTFISFPEIARECGVDANTAHNWANYHRFFEKHNLLGKPVVLRSDFERFKREHAELIKTPIAA